MPSFVHPALLWGLAIVGVPVLIHLINLLRHRRVRWAAMEFLVASQKRNRTRVLLKQLLLLLLRMTAVAAVVLVLAEPLLRDQWGSLFGRSKTHHVVLWDDSFSMSDRWADTSAFDEAKRAIERIGEWASRRTQTHTFTLLRFSEAERLAAGPQPDLLQQTVDVDFAARLRKLLAPLAVSHTAATPAAALEAIDDLVSGSDADRRIVYLVSDFRARQWDDPHDLRDRLRRLTDSGTKLQLIDCADSARPNLSLANLAPAEGTRAAGVPLIMEVAVTNHGSLPVKDVTVLVEADGRPQPAVKVSQIPPGETVKERFQVRFARAGEHAITARLETDAVAADNARYGVVDFPERVPVLLIDGDPEATDARYLSAALAPGGPVTTGISPQIERPRYLGANSLDEFGAIYLMNVDRLEPSAVEAVEDYLRAGGGVAVFAGERTSSRLINDSLYRNGEGFFPVPVTGQAELVVDRLQKAPDLKVSPHPIFRIFAGERNSFIATVIVERYLAVPAGWEPGPQSTARVIARLRNGAPLAVERNFGDGRVAAFLTTAGPVWNNWARNNPSFVVAMLQLQAFLADRPIEISRPVGGPLDLVLDPPQYQPRVRFMTPDADAPPVAADAVPDPNGMLAVSLPSADSSGVYEAVLRRKDGTQEIRRFALNVDAAEGDLKTVSSSELAARLEGVDYEYYPATRFEYAGQEAAGYNLSEMLLYVLILLLVGEQILAWSASYHPHFTRSPARQGGAR
ncbi:MAG: BatA domain-containing protein [Planctomycetota bacterium]|jgi:hypothetical protein